MTDVFISYSAQDRETAAALAARLQTAGLSVFVDFEVLIPGESFSEAIAAEIREARVVLLLLSKNSQRSSWVQDELAGALEKGDSRRVVPVLLDAEGRRNWIWPLVANRQSLEVKSLDDLNAVVEVAKSIVRPSARRDESTSFLASTSSPRSRSANTWTGPTRTMIGLAVVVVMLAIAWRLFQGDGGEAKIWEFGVKVLPKPIQDPKPAAKPKQCRLPEHGVEAWAKTERWTADSDWRKGGSSSAEFCGAQKLAREAKYPDHEVHLLGMDEKHRSEYTPFRQDYYRYNCLFEDRWEPIYKLAENEHCPSQ